MTKESGLNQVSVNILIRNVDGRYLMQFRDGKKDVRNPLTWEFFGGGCEHGETVLDAAVREIGEELKVNIDPGDLKVIAHETWDGISEVLLEYGQPLEWGQFQVCEGAGCGYFDKEELLRVAVIPRVAHFVKKYFS